MGCEFWVDFLRRFFVSGTILRDIWGGNNFHLFLGEAVEGVFLGFSLGLF